MKRFWRLGLMSAVLGVVPISWAQPATAPATAPVDYSAVYPRSRGVRAFARARAAEGGVPYSLARSMYSSADLPELHAMLLDLKEEPAARMRAGIVIGYLSRDPSSIPVLLESVRRADDLGAQRAAGSPLGGEINWKVRALESVGLVGGDEASEILRQAITPEGAVELAKAWIDLPLPGVAGGREQVIKEIRGRAAMGLVYTQVPRNVELVSEFYQRAEQDPSQNFGALAEAMARRDMIVQMGLEEMLLQTTGGRGRGAIAPYLSRYSRRGAYPSGPATAPGRGMNP
jgi:hypothetical protein